MQVFVYFFYYLVLIRPLILQILYVGFFLNNITALEILMNGKAAANIKHHCFLAVNSRLAIP